MCGSRPSRKSSSSHAVGRTPGARAAPGRRWWARARASETKWTLIGSAAVGGSYAAAGVRTAWWRGRRRRDGTGSGEAGAQRASRRRRPRPVARRVGRSRLGGKCSNGAWRGRRGAATGRGQARARRRRRGPVAWCLRRADVARRVWWWGRRGTAAAATPLGPRSSEKVKRRWRGFSFSAASRWNLAQIGPRPRGRPRRDGRYGRRAARCLRRGVVGRAVGRRFGALPVQIYAVTRCLTSIFDYFLFFF